MQDHKPRGSDHTGVAFSQIKTDRDMDGTQGDVAFDISEADVHEEVYTQENDEVKILKASSAKPTKSSFSKLLILGAVVLGVIILISYAGISKGSGVQNALTNPGSPSAQNPQGSQGNNGNQGVQNPPKSADKNPQDNKPPKNNETHNKSKKDDKKPQDTKTTSPQDTKKPQDTTSKTPPQKTDNTQDTKKPGTTQDIKETKTTDTTQTTPTTVNSQDPKGVVTTPVAKSYILPAIFHDTYPDVSTIHGQHDEAYGFLLCTPPDADSYLQDNIKALQVAVYKLIKDGEAAKRDIIVVACEFSTKEQLEIFERMGVIVVRVPTILPDREILDKHWKYNFTKFHFWKLIFWNRILVIDIDILSMDGFYEIWNEPAAKIRTEPPKDWEGKIWFGQKVEDLFPFVHAAVIDTFLMEQSKRENFFNGGLYIMKPSIAHWNMLMNITFDLSIRLPSLEQAGLNIVYGRDGPLEWTKMDVLYDWTPWSNPLRADVKGYHGKFWVDNPPSNFGYLSGLWQSIYKDFKKDWFSITITPEKPTCSAKKESLTIDGLGLSSNDGTLYYLATDDLTWFPTAQEIFDNYEGEDIEISSDETIGFNVDELDAETDYRIFYYAETSAQYAPRTDVYYIDCSTTN